MDKPAVMQLKKDISKSRKDTAVRQTMRRLSKNKSAMFGAILFGAIVIICVFAPVFAPYGPNDLDLTSINSFPTLKHPFGTDALGRDLSLIHI